MENSVLKYSQLRKWLLTFLAMCFFFGGQGKDLRKIFRALDKGDLPKTLELIQESLDDEPVNPGARYVLAQLLSDDSLALYNLDSARVTIWQSIKDFEIASEDELEDLEKNEISIDDIQTLNVKIQEQHYQRAVKIHSIASFELFMSWYPEDVREKGLIKLRDSIIWSGTKPEYSSAAYRGFFESYPSSFYAPEARSGFDSLVYLEETNSDKLADYRQFLSNYPQTPYRDEIELIIFERMTASNLPHDYQQFMQDFPSSKQVGKATSIWFHLDPMMSLEGIPQADSLRSIRNMDSSLAFPTFENGRYRFLNSDGAAFNIAFGEIHEDYLCGDIQSDFFFGFNDQGEVYNRLGQLSYQGSFQKATDLGLGVILLEDQGNNRLLHKSGFIIYEGLEEAAAIGNQWLRIKVDGKYGLISNTGYPITLFKYDDIYREGGYWVFEKSGSIAVYTTERIMEQLHDDALELEFKFDEIEVVQDTLLIGFRRDWECLMDNSLDFLIPWGEYEVVPGDPFHYARTDEGYRFSRLQPASPRGLLSKLVENEEWIGVGLDSSWTLYPKNDIRNPITGIDSLYLVGDFTAVMRDDSARNQVLFPNRQQFELLETQKIVAISAVQLSELSDYITIQDDLNTSLWNRGGEFLFSGPYEEIKPLRDSLFVVKQRGKLGLLDQYGKEVLPIQYDAMQESDGLIFLLYRNKIGAYDLVNNLSISPRYESKLERFGDHFITRIDGSYGVINQEEKKVVDFDYEQIRYWNDSTAWVKKDNFWELIRLRDQEPLMTEITNFEMLIERDTIKLASYYGGLGYGMLSNARGELLPSKFNDIRNIGNQENPVFVAELYSPEAAYYILLYINGEGKKLGSYAFREEDYDRIYCED